MHTGTDPTEYRTRTSASPWNVLLVDDDEDDAILVQKMLVDARIRHIRLSWATSFEVGLGWLETETFDAILVDYDLGPHTGLELVRKAISNGAKVPFILYTGRGSYEIDLEAMRAGVTDYLSKFEATGPLLERTIRYAIEHKQHQDELAASNQQLKNAYEEVGRLVEERTAELSRANRELRSEIEERKRIQTELQDREARLRILLQQLPLIAYTTDRELRITSMQGKAAPIMEETGFLMISRVITDEASFAHGGPIASAHRKALQGEAATVEFEAGGRWFQAFIEPYRDRDGQITGCLGVAIDLTEQKQASEALHTSNKVLEKTFSSLHLLTALLDRDFRFIRVNENYAAAEGRHPDEFIGLKHFDLYPNEGNEAIFRRVVETGVPHITFARPFEYVSSPERGISYWDWSLHPIFDEEGRVESLVLTLLDVTGRMRDQQQIEYQAYLLENVTDAVIAADNDLRITAWNKAAEQIYGWSAEEVLGRPTLELFTPPPELMAENIKQYLDEMGGFQIEHVQRRRDGTAVDIETKVEILRDEEGRMTGFVAVNRDITERKRIEKELVEIRSRLVQSQEVSRLALAQEIHDGPVQALYALLYRIVGVQAAAHNEREAVELGVLREELRAVIETLRAISVELRPPALAPYGLEKAIRSHIETILHRHPPFNIHLELDSDGQLLPASTRLAMYRIYQEAMMNTLRHAHASNVEVHLALKPGEVELAIQDDGVGFQVPERMVDLVREGHLGLVGAYERAQAAGLSLELASYPGKGTQVRVTAARPEQGTGG